MRVLHTSFLFLIVLSAVAAARQDQQPGVRRMQFNSDNAFLLNEVGAVITEEQGVLKVIMVGPKERRTKGSEDSDLFRGDEVIMVNGKRMKGIKDLQDAYATTTAGSEFKIGVRRNEERAIVTVLKADPKDLPQRQLIMAGGLPGGGEALPALGLMLRNGKDSVIVHRVLPAGLEVVRNSLKEGDRITALNTTKVNDVKSFVDVWDVMKQGDQVTLTYQRDGKERNLEFKKPRPMGGPMIIRQ